VSHTLENSRVTKAATNTDWPQSINNGNSGKYMYNSLFQFILIPKLHQKPGI